MVVLTVSADASKFNGPELYTESHVMDHVPLRKYPWNSHPDAQTRRNAHITASAASTQLPARQRAH
jgi:hypothetical protein